MRAIVKDKARWTRSSADFKPFNFRNPRARFVQARPRGCYEFRHHFACTSISIPSRPSCLRRPPLTLPLHSSCTPDLRSTVALPDVPCSLADGCICTRASSAITCVASTHVLVHHGFFSFVSSRPLRIRSDLSERCLRGRWDQLGSKGEMGASRVGFKSCAVGGGLRHASSSWRRRRKTKGAANRRSRGLPLCLPTNASPKSAGKNAKGAVPWSK